MHWIQKSAKIISVAFLCLCTSVMLKLDPSMTKIDPTLIPEVANPSVSTRPPMVLVSYADGAEVFYQNQAALAASAADKGFDTIYNFRRNALDAKFSTKNKHILDLPRGAGYWVWKPYVILKAMEASPEGSLILYADSGVVFKKSLHKLVAHFKDYDRILVGYGTPIPLEMQLKKESYSAFSFPITQNILDAQALWGFFLGLRNTHANRQFVKMWLKACENVDAVSDSPLDPSHQNPRFDAHLHDQALLSVLAAHDPENTLIIRRNIFRNDYGVYNFHRHPHVRFLSPFMASAGFPLWMNDYIWNNPLIETFRRVLGWLSQTSEWGS
jgi:hypothetical protein